MAKPQGKLEGISKTGLRWVNFPGYEAASERYDIAAAVVIPPNRTLVALSGHVGRNPDLSRPDDLEEEYRLACDVRPPCPLVFNCHPVWMDD